MLTQSIFKANDIRGLVTGDDVEWDVAGAAALGHAYAHLSGLGQGTVLVGRDMRQRGDELSEAFISGVVARGGSVVRIGLTSTDEVWFAAGSLNLPAVQFTASHNPAEYNGMKFCLPGALPVSADFVADLGRLAMRIDAGDTSELPDYDGDPGQIGDRDILDDYASYLLSLVDLSQARRLRVVVDAGNGMAGHTVPAVMGQVNVEVIGLYLDLDGTFPNHPANPLIPENLVDARRAVREHEADLALVFDGDADRCFVIDERGEVVNPSAITAMIATAALAREPGATIVVNTITSAAVAEIVAEHGGTTVVSKVGHTFVKALMASRHAIFGGEHSAHYYFRDFWGADTGMLAGLYVMSLLGASDRPLSDIVGAYTRYASSGEINFPIANAREAQERVAEALGRRGEISWTDGLKVTGDGWWASLRASNTEPMLRLNVEGRTPELMAAVRDDVLDLVRPQES